jgi:hypothetical protein
VYSSYISVIERYFLPYFGDKPIETLTATDILQFESWRNRQMQRVPKASTLNTFAAAWGKVLEAGVAKGWISERATIPRLSTRGEKSTPRPAFSKDEVDHCNDPLISCSGVMFSTEIAHEYRDGRRDQALDGESEVSSGS